MSNGYNDDSIKSLKGADRVRERPAVMFGSEDIKGAFHTVKEILGNSLDEARAGYGDKVVVTYHTDGSISVQDFGRGVPMDWNEAEERFNWDLIFNELYAGGKYDPDNTDYEYSIGLNGLGAASTQYTSEWFKVVSKRSDFIYEKDFIKGEPTEDELKKTENTTGETGTFIHWKIDKDVFHDTEFSPDMFIELLESQAYINSIIIEFVDEKRGKTYRYEGKGIQEYLKEKLGNSVIDMFYKENENTGIENGKNYRAKIELVLAITEETRSRHMFYHNTGTMITGVHRLAFESAINDFFKDLGKQNGVKIIPYDYKDYISCLVSTYSNITSFANQTKDGVSNSFIHSLIYFTVKDMLEEAVAMQKECMVTLINNVLTAALARKKAKELEQQEKLVSKAVSTKRPKPDKFDGCRERDPRKRELFIVEGDSAKGSCKQARNSHYQALLAVRGKTANALKKSIEDLLKNEEIQNIINVVGTGIDVDGVDLFDMDKLQYDKIIITTDADIDGYQIRALIYTIFYRLMPRLLEEGKVYVAETPLFELEMSNGESWFAYDAEEREELEKKAREMGLGIRKINRSKGLGENNPDMLWETTMNPETRRLVQLKIDIKDQIVRDISNMLFGLDPHKERKSFVFSVLEQKLNEDVELSELIDTLDAIETKEEVEEAI